MHTVFRSLNLIPGFMTAVSEKIGNVAVSSKNSYGNFKFDLCDTFLRTKNLLKVDDLSNVIGFKIPTKIILERDASP